MSNQIIPEVERLIHACRDSEELFRHAAAQAEDNELRAMLEEYALQSRSFLVELQNEAIAFGESSPTDSTSITGSVTQGWLNLRDAVISPDNNTLIGEAAKQLESTEDAYRAAVATTTLPDALKDIVARQYAQVSAQREYLRTLNEKGSGDTA